MRTERRDAGGGNQGLTVKFHICDSHGYGLRLKPLLTYKSRFVTSAHNRKIFEALNMLVWYSINFVEMLKIKPQNY